MQYVVIGLGTFGGKISQTLMKHGAEVIAIDQDKEKVEAIKDLVTIAMSLDSTDENAMNAAQLGDADAAVVALGEAQEEAILTTVILKKMGIHPIIARAANALYAHVLTRVGAEQVIIIEEQAGEEIAKRLLAPEIHERIILTTGHSLVEIEAKKTLIGKTLMEMDIRKKYNLNVIGIQKKKMTIDEEGKVIQSVHMNDLPGPNDIIEEGDVLMVVGADEDIEKLTLTPEV